MNHRISFILCTIALAIIAAIVVLTVPSLTSLARQPEINPDTPAQPESGWVTDTLDLSYTVYDLVLDSSGSPKIIAKPSGNYAALIEQTTTGWRTTILDSLPYGGSGNVSVQIDESDFIHFVYPCRPDSGGYPICYAYQDALGWNFHVTDLTGSYVSLALDKDNLPHFSFSSDYPLYGLNYAYLDSTGWHSTEVDGETGVGIANRLALDDIGYPHITYYNELDASLKYAYKDINGWHVETITGPEEGIGTDMVIDSQGIPHISRLGGASRNLYHTYLDGSTWKSDLVDTISEGYGQYTTIKLTDHDQPRIAYNFGIGAKQLRFASLESDVWVTQTVDLNLSNFKEVILQVDQDNQPHILYSDQYRGMKYAYYKSDVSPISGLTAQVIGDAIQGKPTIFAASVQEGTYVSYAWNFGDGGTGAGKNTNHTYNEAGIFDVAVTASNEVSTSTYTFTIEVQPHSDVFLPLIPESDVNFVYTYSGLCVSYDPGVKDVDVTITWCVPQVWVRSTGEMQVFTTWTAKISPITTCISKYSDEKYNMMYLTDENGGRYDHVETGDAARYDSILCNGKTLTGWFLFPPANQGMHNFTFHDDDQRVEIEGIIIGP